MSAAKDMLQVNVALDRYVSDEVLDGAVMHVFGLTRERIFVKGLAADEGKIGNYSTKPLYFNPANSPRKFAPKGKTGESKFKSGKPHVTRYFPDGYKGVRGAAGRQSSFVDLKFGNPPKLMGSWLPERRGDEWVIGFNNPVDAEKAQGNESRFGKVVFALTKTELNVIPRIIGSLAS